MLSMLDVPLSTIQLPDFGKQTTTLKVFTLMQAASWHRILLVDAMPVYTLSTKIS